MAASYLGGAVWCYSLTASSVAAELLLYRASQAEVYRLWFGLLGGSGLWSVRNG